MPAVIMDMPPVSIVMALGWVASQQSTQSQIRQAGEVRFQWDQPIPVQTGKGGWLEISQQQGEDHYELSVRGGVLRYRINGQERPFDARARQWLKHLISTQPAVPAPPKAS
ncbi:hypothetical protein [Parachitinimonas caeni]|uniref:Uncharacterized protein n=1 Tax=Parachitinimonas caeni TaxID=3031301 RepID=A0ABT7DXZ9_9NEIS|nr:hypothetical protein [Parachitinimonas caeni]MDK2124933.1 hypothetical protein [Parachitinimonas caeni]